MTLSLLLERTDDVLERLYQATPTPNPTLLFQATELSDYAAQSPLWVQTTEQSPLFEAIRNDPDNWPCVVLESQGSTQALLAHLRHLLFVAFGEGRRGVLRYWSPTTASYLFAAADFPALSLWLGPVSRIRWYGGRWADRAQGELRWFYRSNPDAATWQAPGEPRSLRLSAAQEQALHLQQTEQVLYRWWQARHPVAFAEITRLYREGVASGLTKPDALEHYLDQQLAARAHARDPLP